MNPGPLPREPLGAWDSGLYVVRPIGDPLRVSADKRIEVTVGWLWERRELSEHESWLREEGRRLAAMVPTAALDRKDWSATVEGRETLGRQMAVAFALDELARRPTAVSVLIHTLKILDVDRSGVAYLHGMYLENDLIADALDPSRLQRTG